MNDAAPRRDLLHFFAQHRVAANLLMVLMILAGVWGLNKLNTQFFPDFELDVVTVRVEWAGASAEDVETAITRPIEQEVRSVNGLKSMTSTSSTGAGVVTLEFVEGTDMGSALDEVNERVALLRNLPETAERPEVTRVIRYEPVARLLLVSQGSLADLRALAYRVRDQLLDRGIAKIDISGLAEQEIAVEVPARRLEELGLGLQDVADRIGALSRDLPAGEIGQGDVARQLRSLEQRRTPEGFAALPLVSDADGRLILLGDVARVRQVAQPGEVHLYKNGRPAVELLLQRTLNADALDSARVLEGWMDEVRPALPPGVDVELYDQSWQPIEERIVLLLENGASGLLLVVIILFLFLRGRIAFWVAVGIPVSFLATLGILYGVGGSINMISLFGLIMALGIIVDDAIVVAENAQTNYEAGEPALTAAEHGARHMFAPVLSSSLTTIAAFLPLMLVGGIIGNIMFQIPLVVVCVVIASFIECMLVLPAHMRFSLAAIAARPPGAFRQRLERGFAHFRDRQFRPAAVLAVRWRGITVAIALALLIMSIGLVAGGRVGFTFFPGVEGTQLLANVSFTAGTPPERVQAFLDDMYDALIDTEAQFGARLIAAAVVKQGTTNGEGGDARGGDQYGSVTVELTSPDQRDVRNQAFVNAWRERIKQPPGVESLTISQRLGGPPGSDIEVRLSGEDATVLKQAAADLKDKLGAYPGVSAIEDDLPWGHEQLVYRLTPTGQSLGLTTESVGRQMRAAFDGALAQIYQDGNDEVEVRVRLPEAERDALTVLNSFNITLADGRGVPLQTVADLSARRGFEILRHNEGRLSVTVTADVDRAQNNANRLLDDLRRNFLHDLDSRYGISHGFEGRAEDQAETFGDLKLGMLIALALIYIVLAWVFASYSKPLVIMTAIPFGFIGAIAGHYLLAVIKDGFELTILSLFGIVGLSGIVVNDAIILIAAYQELRASGVPVQDAIIEAACARLRAVLLTSLTTIGGLAPLLFETSVQAQFLIPMAASIVFGLVFSTFLILLVIPAILSFIESASQRVAAWRTPAEARA